MIDLVCYLIALILFLLAAFTEPVPRRNLLALGLAFAVFPLLWDAIQAVG